jgi:hypothetical protein
VAGGGCWSGWAALLDWAAVRWTRPKRTGGGCKLLLIWLKAELGRKAGRVKVKAYLFLKGTKQMNLK